MTTYFEALENPDCDTILTQQQPITWDGGRLPMTRAPLFGEHTHAVLSELLGMTDDEFASFAADGTLS